MKAELNNKKRQDDKLEIKRAKILNKRSKSLDYHENR